MTPIHDAMRPRFLTLPEAERFMNAFENNQLTSPYSFGAIPPIETDVVDGKRISRLSKVWESAPYEIQTVVKIGKPCTP